MYVEGTYIGLEKGRAEEGHHSPDTTYHDDYIPTPWATHHKYLQSTACPDRPPPTDVASPHNHPQVPE